MPDEFNKSDIFKRLDKLLSHGPLTVHKGGKLLKVRDLDTKSTSWAASGKTHKKVAYYIYQNMMQYDITRRNRYIEYEMMEQCPEIHCALNIMADDSTTTNEDRQILKVSSDNEKLQEILENLFYDILNIEFNLYSWVRNLCKFGDHFLLLDLHPEYGVVGFKEIPAVDVEREEAYDPDNPNAYRFKILSMGESKLENYEIAHFRLITDTMFLPYGRSQIEGSRRIWKTLMLLEDAVLIYRVSRAPERRVFKVDVAGINPKDIPAYMELQKNMLKRTMTVDPMTGRMDLKFNPESVLEDFFIPIRGGQQGSTSDISTLAGGSLTNQMDDVTYMQGKMIASLGVPKTYLSYEEDLGSKGSLSQQDVRFSRTIERIQRIIESELNKIARIHLFINGFDDDELLDFELELTNPSTVAEQMKLDLMDKRVSTATNWAQSNLVSTQWIREKVLQLSPDEMIEIDKGIVRDHKFMAKMQEIDSAGMGGGLGGDMGAGGDMGGVPGAEGQPPEGGEEQPQIPSEDKEIDDILGVNEPKDLIPNDGKLPGEDLLLTPKKKEPVINYKRLHTKPNSSPKPMKL